MGAEWLPDPAREPRDWARELPETARERPLGAPRSVPVAPGLGQGAPGPAPEAFGLPSAPAKTRKVEDHGWTPDLTPKSLGFGQFVADMGPPRPAYLGPHGLGNR